MNVLRLNPRHTLIAMSALAVIGDSMLVPFYPLFFAERYGATSPAFTGAYLAAICGTVMVALPIWARFTKRVHPVRLLVATLPAAAVLSVASAFAPTLIAFWALSLAMIACKASYLLMYPYALSLERKDEHAGMIGILAVVVHFGAILGAVAGGAALQLLTPRDVFFVMALSDLAQMLLCVSLLKTIQPLEHAKCEITSAPTSHTEASIIWLLVTMAIFYFGAFLARPFFTTRWAEVSGLESPLAGGGAFALPALVALVGLAINRRRHVDNDDLHRGLPVTLGLGMTGLALQAFPNVPAMLLGRAFFGWSMFQATVALDALLFAASRPDQYALDFSKANFAQNLGVVVASLAAGGLVAFCGTAAPFLAGAAAFGITLMVAPRVDANAKRLQLLSSKS